MLESGKVHKKTEMRIHPDLKYFAGSGSELITRIRIDNSDPNLTVALYKNCHNFFQKIIKHFNNINGCMVGGSEGSYHGRLKYSQYFQRNKINSSCFYQYCGSKYIEFGSGSGSRILAQFGSGSRSGFGSKVILSILKDKIQNYSRGKLFS